MTKKRCMLARGTSFWLEVAWQKDPKMSESINKVGRRKAVDITFATANVLTMQECATKVQRAAGLSTSGRRAELGAVFHGCPGGWGEENVAAHREAQSHGHTSSHVVWQCWLRVLGGSLFEAQVA